MENKMPNDTASRIKHMDFLKFVGLTGIIVAHVDSPNWAMMFRSFDVPLMVIISSILAYKSFSKMQGTNASILRYYITRVKRLVIPTWLFLLLYFLLCFIFKRRAETLLYYVASFCLTRYGIGYVWIILVYLYSAMLIPLFNKLKLTPKGIVIICFSYVLYEVAYYYKIGLVEGVAKTVVETTIYYIIPYGVLTYLGYNYHALSQSTKRIMLISSIVVFVLLAIYYYTSTGRPQLVQIAKYPPRLYYLSYGVACSFGLLILCEKHSYRFYENTIFRYISVHSMWIYLWHILVLTAYDYIRLPQIWFVKLIVVYIVSVLIVQASNKLYDFVEKRLKIPLIKYLRG